LASSIRHAIYRTLSAKPRGGPQRSESACPLLERSWFLGIQRRLRPLLKLASGRSSF